MQNEQILEIQYEGRQKAFWPDAMARNYKAGLFFDYSLKFNNMIVFKVIFIVFEVCFILAVILTAFLTDWNEAFAEGNLQDIHLLMVVCTLSAVICQHEQQKISWNE